MGWVMNFLKEPGLQVRVFDDQARDSCWSLAMDGRRHPPSGLMRTSTGGVAGVVLRPMALPHPR